MPCDPVCWGTSSPRGQAQLEHPNPTREVFLGCVLQQFWLGSGEKAARSCPGGSAGTRVPPVRANGPCSGPALSHSQLPRQAGSTEPPHLNHPWGIDGAADPGTARWLRPSIQEVCWAIDFPSRQEGSSLQAIKPRLGGRPLVLMNVLLRRTRSPSPPVPSGTGASCQQESCQELAAPAETPN